MNKHKYSTYFLILFLLLIPACLVMAALDSSDIDDLCSVNGSFLYKNPANALWQCGNLTDTVVTITINNVTNIINNQSLHSNHLIGATSNVSGDLHLLSGDITFENPATQEINGIDIDDLIDKTMGGIMTGLFTFTVGTIFRDDSATVIGVFDSTGSDVKLAVDSVDNWTLFGTDVVPNLDGFYDLGIASGNGGLRRWNNLIMNGSIRNNSDALTVHALLETIDDDSGICLRLNGSCIYSWDNVNGSTFNQSLDTTSSVRFENVNVTNKTIANYIGLLGTNPEYPLHAIGGEDAPNTLINIFYNRTGAVVSPFEYRVAMPSSMGQTGNFISTITQAYLQDQSNRSGNNFMYGNYIFLGGNGASTVQQRGSRLYIWDFLTTGFTAPAFGEIGTNGTMEVGHHKVNLIYPSEVGTNPQGEALMYGGWTTYAGNKVQNILGGTRTYETYGYRTTDFEDCSADDTCYGFWAEDSNSLFEGFVNLTDDFNQMSGDTFTNVIYGEMFNYSKTDALLEIEILQAGVYYNITNLTTGDCNGFTFEQPAGAGTQLRAMYDGLYKMSFTMSFESIAVGGLFGVAVAHNYDVETHRNCYSRREAATAVGNVGVTCIMDLEVGDNVSVLIENENTNRNIKIHTANLNLQRIGNFEGH